MTIKTHFDHVNFNVTDIARSIEFYRRALGIAPVREINADDGSFRIVFLANADQSFGLELTWLRDHPQPYELGDNESHLAVRVEGDYDEARRHHREMGCICFENHDMGLYFINDPDDYWIEILPAK